MVERRPASRVARPPPQGGGGTDPSGSLRQSRVRRRDGAGGCGRWKGTRPAAEAALLVSQGRDDRRATGAAGGSRVLAAGGGAVPPKCRTISSLAAGCPGGAPSWPSDALQLGVAGRVRSGRPSPRAQRRAAGEQGRDQRSSAGPLLTPARGEPRGGRRKLSRRPLLPPREPGAPAGEAGEIVPRDFWGGGARAGAGEKANVGRGCERAARGPPTRWRGGRGET